MMVLLLYTFCLFFVPSLACSRVNYDSNPNDGNRVKSVGHVSLTDRKGDSIIMEYIQGKLIVHHDR